MSTEAAPAVASPVLDAFRRWGYLEADLDPLGRLKPAAHPELALGGDEAERARRWYCGTIAVEFMHIPEPERRALGRRRGWSGRRRRSTRDRVLDELLRAETVRADPTAALPGTKRFSIEGVDRRSSRSSTEVLDGAAAHGAEQVVLAMSHRGRLNVMAYGRSAGAAEIFAGFEDVDPRSVLGGGRRQVPPGRDRHVRAHADGREVDIHLVSNPSHLEAVDPVAMGRVRAKQVRLGDAVAAARCCRSCSTATPPSPARGSLAETLNFAALAGYSSRRHDPRRGQQPDRLHHRAARLQLVALRHRRRRAAADPDLPRQRRGPRRGGARGADRGRLPRRVRERRGGRPRSATAATATARWTTRRSPSRCSTRRSRRMPPLWQSYAARAGDRPRGGRGASAARVQGRAAARRTQRAESLEKKPPLRTLPPYWDRVPRRAATIRPSTRSTPALAPAELAAPDGGARRRRPPGFHVHPKVQKLLEQRRRDGRRREAARLRHGRGARLRLARRRRACRCGSPARTRRRGTFNQRHAVLIDVEDEREYVPLAARRRRRQAPSSRSTTRCSRRPPSLGFEYGFSRDYPEALVLLGGAVRRLRQRRADHHRPVPRRRRGQVGAALRPRAAPAARLRGAGAGALAARASSASSSSPARTTCRSASPRPRRSTSTSCAARRCASWRKPLVVFTPKSMLRHADAASTVADLGRAALPERARPTPQTTAHARGILLATGKIVHELRARARAKRERDGRRDRRPRAALPVPRGGARGRARAPRARPARSSGSRRSRRTWAPSSSSMPSLERLARGTARPLGQALRLRQPGHRLGQGPRPRAEDAADAGVRVAAPGAAAIRTRDEPAFSVLARYNELRASRTAAGQADLRRSRRLPGRRPASRAPGRRARRDPIAADPPSARSPAPRQLARALLRRARARPGRTPARSTSSSRPTTCWCRTSSSSRALA